jgi:hypothetical protein
MNVRPRPGVVMISLLLSPLGVQSTEPSAAPAVDADFLEYLGTWDGNDQDWLVVASVAADAQPGPRPSPAAEPRPTDRAAATGRRAKPPESSR